MNKQIKILFSSLSSLHKQIAKDGKSAVIAGSDTIIFPKGRGYYIAEGTPSNRFSCSIFFIGLRISSSLPTYNVSFPFVNYNVHVFLNYFFI